MSIFDDIGNGFKSLGNDIKKGGHEIDSIADQVAGKIKSAVEDTVNAAKNEVTSLVNTVKSTLTGLIDEAKADATKLFDEAKSHADQIVGDATKKFEDGIQNARELAADAKQDVTNLSFKAEDIIKDATRGIQTEAIEAKNALDGVGDTIKADIQKAGTDIESGIEEFGQKIIDEFDTIKDALGKELSEDALKKALHGAHTFVSWMKGKMDALGDSKPALVDKLNSINDTINLGPIALNYANFYTRLDDLAETLDTLTSQEIKLTQTFVIDAVNALAPTTISIDADIEFLSRFGDDIKSIPIEIITEWLPDILDELGVPKE